MKITSWNVNSVRSRLDRVLAWLDDRQVDVLGLQETKVVDEDFPREPFEERGYHVETFGQKTYNGVALLAKLPLEDVRKGFGEDPWDDQKRVIAATAGGVRVICVYVPNGQSPESEKFTYKLQWFQRLEAYLSEHAQPTDPLVLFGDFNVAPEERDVWDVDLWRGKVHFHPKEHAALARLQAWGLSDLFREHEAAEKKFTWWDYRQLAFPKNKGLRIDLAYGTKAASERCTGVHLDREARKIRDGLKPSDHIPVTVFLDEPFGFPEA